MIKKHTYLYLLLVITVLVQVFAMRTFDWFPDLILLIVVFTGVFIGGIEAVILGFVAGFLRGCFSLETLLLDIFLFPMIGMISSLISKMFYRQNHGVQILTTMVAIFTLVSFQTFYLNVISENNIGIPFVFLESWPHLVITAILAPFIFTFIRVVLHMEE